MQAQLFAGEYDPTTTRVVSLVANPAAEVARLQQAAKLDRLTAENEELRAALARAATAAAMQAATATSQPAPSAAAAAAQQPPPLQPPQEDPSVTAAVATAEVKLLSRKLAAAEKQTAALKDVFNKRVKAFRDSVR